MSRPAYVKRMDTLCINREPVLRFEYFRNQLTIFGY